MSEPIRTYTLPAARLVEWSDHVHTFLCDGSENVYYPPLQDADYLFAMAEMGYSDPMRYTVEHEIAHHLVAALSPDPSRIILVKWESPLLEAIDGKHQYMSAVISRIIYNACHNIPQSMEEQASKDEEHLANRLARYANLGEADSYGELERVFGDRLAALAGELLRISRPWVQVKA